MPSLASKIIKYIRNVVIPTHLQKIIPLPLEKFQLIQSSFKFSKFDAVAKWIVDIDKRLGNPDLHRKASLRLLQSG